MSECQESRASGQSYRNAPVWIVDKQMRLQGRLKQRLVPHPLRWLMWSMGRQGWLDVSAGCFFASLLVFAVTVHYCSVGPALLDSTGGLCSCVLCVALIFRGTLVKSCVSVLHSVDGQPVCSAPSIARVLYGCRSFVQNTHASFYNTEDNSSILRRCWTKASWQQKKDFSFPWFLDQAARALATPHCSIWC